MGRFNGWQLHMLNRFRLTHRFWFVMGMYWIVFMVAVGVGLAGLNMARDSLREVYTNRMSTMTQVEQLLNNLFEGRLNILLAFQHDPKGPLAVLHDHEVDAHLMPIQRAGQSNAQIREQLNARAMDSHEETLLKTIFERQDEWDIHLNAAASAIEKGDFSPQTMQAFLVAGRTQAEAVVQALTVFQQYQVEQASQAASFAEQRNKLGMLLFALIVFVGAVPATIFMVMAMRRMTRGFSLANTTATRIAQGDLTQPIEIEGQDEISHFLGHMDIMQKQLARLVSSIHRSTHALVEVSRRVTNGAALLSDRTDQQASSLQETSAATEELNSTVHQNAANAAQAEQSARAAADVARQGGAAVEQVVHTMQAISDSSEQIAAIVNIIDGIAFQTNILALNAAVEAARAGVQGRGFAVVAAEVRALAQRSSAAANEVKELIESSGRIVEEGNHQVTDAGTRMEGIMSRNEQINVLIQEIATASQEQSIGLNQINQAISLMDETTHQNVTLVEDTVAAAQALQGQIDELRRYVSVFTVAVDTEFTPTDTQPAILTSQRSLAVQ